MSGHSAEKGAPVSGIRFVKIGAQCPHCDVRKHQIDTSEEHAIQVVQDAMDRHIEEAHSDV